MRPRACAANFSLPAVGPDFAEVLFVEAQPPEALAIAAEQSRLVRRRLARRLCKRDLPLTNPALP